MQQITTEIIGIMSDEELQNLGVTHMGDRVILKNICKNINRKHFVLCMFGIQAINLDLKISVSLLFYCIIFLFMNRRGKC